MRNLHALEIRPAQPRDAASLVVLLNQLGYERSLAEVTRHIGAATADPETTVLVALAAGGRVAGCLQVVVTRRLAEGDRGEIASLVVDTALRSQGIGGQLARAAAEWLQARGLGRLRVRCNIKRGRAHRFYEDFGFQYTKSQKVFDLKLQHASRSSESV
jgi:ribosomal protein S18 acetylase RimI-like enzyme